MRRDFDGSFVAFGCAQSEQAKRRLLKLPFPPRVQARLAARARQSVEEQQRIEAADSVPFEIFRREYLDRTRLGA
jgi:glutamate--cysteine ligase